MGFGFRDSFKGFLSFKAVIILFWGSLQGCLRVPSRVLQCLSGCRV